MVLTVSELGQTNRRPLRFETKLVRRWRWDQKGSWLGKLLLGCFKVRDKFVAGGEVRRKDG